MSYNFIQESRKKVQNVDSLSEKNSLTRAKKIVDLALKEVKYKPEEIKVLIVGINEESLQISKELEKRCENIYYMSNKSNDYISNKIKDLKCEIINNNENIIIDSKKLKEEICKMDIVFITENELDIDKNVLILMSTETIIIDITKENNSVDLESAKKLGIKVIELKY